MIYSSHPLEEQAALQAAAKACAAAQTAAKAHGEDTLHAVVLTGGEKESLARKTEETGRREAGEKMGTRRGRDAASVREAQAVVPIGAGKKRRGVPRCGFCEFHDCGGCEKAGGNRRFSDADLGIAAGSAVDTASMDKAGCRVMDSVGKAAAETDFAPGCVWLGFPLSVSGKNIFFDRGIFHG